MIYIVDIILLVVFALFIIVGIKRGVVRSAVHFVGAVVSAVLSSIIGGSIATWLFNTLFREALVQKISDTIMSFGANSLTSAVDGLLTSLPDFLTRALESAGVTAASLEGMLSTSSGKTAEKIADSLSPLFVSYIKVLVVIVLFLLFMMIVRAIAEMVDKMFDLPILREVNGALGGLFGFLLALVSVWVVISAIQVFLPMLADETRADIEHALSHSMITGLLVKLDPIRGMFT